MRFRHLTSAVAQILLNASSGPILKGNDFLLVGNAYHPQFLNLTDSTIERFAPIQTQVFAATSDKIAVAYNGNAVKVFDHSGNELANISGPNGVNFGMSVQMSDTKIFVSAPGDNTSGTASGAVYVYDHDGSNETKITFPGSANDYSGNGTDRIAVGSGKIAIGSEYYPSFSFKGKVDLMDEDGSNVITIYPALPNQSNFGSAVKFHNDKLYISAAGSSTQKVYEYDLSGNLLRTFDAPQGGLSLFGGDISFYGSKMAVGAEGASKCYIFDLESVSQEYIEVSFTGHHTQQRSSGRIGFGKSLELTSEYLFVGAPFEETSGVSNSGLIFQYDHNGSFITKYDVTGFDTLNNNQNNNQIGTNMTYVPGPYPEKLIVAEGRKTYATDRKVYVMDMNGENVIELPEPEGLTQSSNSQYASNIEIASEGKLVVIHNESKTAYVYDLTTTNEPTSFTLDGSNSTEDYDFVLDGNKLHTLGIVGGYRKKLMRYDITTGNLEAAFTTSGNYTLIPSTIDVGNGKVVVASGLGTTRRIFTYDIDDTTGASETMITPSKAATESLWNPCRLAVGNGKIVFGDSHTDAIFYIYNLDGSNEIAVDCSNVPLSSYWGSNYTIPSTQRVGYKSVAIGNDKIVVDGGSVGVAFVCNLDGSGLFAIDMMDSSYGLSSDEVAGAATEVAGSLSIANNKIAISAVQGRVSGNNTDGIVYTFDLDGTNMKQIVSPRGPVSGYQFGKDVAIYDPTGLAKFANLPAVISDIDASYTLTEGQDTVITAVGTDPEGDAITWSFEEVKSGTSYVVVGASGDDDNGSNSGSVYVYDANDLSAQPTKLTAFDGVVVGQQFGSSVTFSADKIIVGAHSDNDNGTNSGSVYVYDANDLSAQPTKLTAFDGAAGDAFGVSVATTSDKIFVGASATDQDGNNSGSVYVYDLNDLSATPTELTAFDGAALDFFGSSVAVAADKVIVAAYGDESNSGAIYVYDANDLSAQPTKLTAFDGAAADFFGYRISTTADKIVVSAFADDDRGSRSGSVYVFDANDLSAQPTKLTAFDGAADDNFGYSVATSADKIIVGAHQDDDNATNSGSVYVYDANDLSAQPTKLTAFDPIDYHVFGQSVAATDDKIFVGAGQDDDKGSNAGAVYVYDANDLSAQPTKLTAYDGAASDNFGIRISAVSAPSSLNDVTVSQSDNVFTITPGSIDSNFTLRFKVTDAAGNVTTKTSTFSYDYVNKAPIVSGVVSEYNLTQGQDTVITATGVDPEGDAITWSFEEVASGSSYVVVGAYGDDDNGDRSGSVYVYDANDLSAQPTKLTAFDGANVDQFGYSVVATADQIFVGVPWDDDNGTNSGSVYVYDVNDLSAQPTKLTAFDAVAEDYFGVSVAATADKIIVGASYDDDNHTNTGSVYVFDANDLSATPTKLTAFDGAANDQFGNSVAVAADKIIVGAYLDDDNGSDSGSVYVFDANDLSAQPTKLTAFDGATSDRFGISVAATADKIIVGAYLDDDNGSDSGSVYVYDTNDLSATPTKLTSFDAAAGDKFGEIIATAADKIIVSAPRDDDNGTDSGSVYVYNANDLSATPTKLTAFDGAANDQFGYSVAVTADKIVVGARLNDDNGTNSGSVYVYDANDLSAQPTKLTAFDGAASDFFGGSVSANVAPSALNGVTVTQSDNVFTVTPGTADADFQLRITATDSEGNATSVTPTFAYDFVNQPPVVSNVDAAYTLTQGQDTVITATGVDPEGDAITWSFEEVGESYVFVRDGSNTRVYDPSTMNLVTTLPKGLSKLSVGSGKFAGMTGTTAWVYDLSDLSAAPIEIPNNPSVDSTALFDNKLYVGQPDQNSNFGQITVYDLNDLNASPTVLYSSSAQSHQQFAKKIRVAGNKLFATQNRAYNEAYGIVQVWDTNDLSAAPTVINNPMNISLDNGWMEVTETHLVFSSVYGYEGSLTHAGTVYVYDLNDLSSPQAIVTASNRSTNDYFGKFLAVSSKYLMVQNDGNTRKVHVFDMTDLSAAPVVLNDGAGGAFGDDLAIVGDNLFVGESDVNNSTGRLFVYDGTDLSSAPQEIAGSREYANFTADMVGYPAPSALNGVTVTQSDNVFTVTPGTADANFQLRITATDSEGNATSVTPTFAYDFVNQPPAVSGIQSTYTLTQGQDTVITATGVDPEGDAITWSFEEVTSGSYTFVQQPYWTNSGGSNIGRVVVYETSDLNTPVAYLSNPYAGVQDADGANVSVYNGKIYVSAHGVSVGGTDNIGAVGVYDAETFEFLHNITPPDAPGNAYHYFSADCAPVVHEGKIYIGARGRSNNYGGVYVFDETTYELVLFIEGDYPHQNFGGTIKIHNGILYVSQTSGREPGTNNSVGLIAGFNIDSLVFNNDPFASANKLESPKDADFIIYGSTTQSNQYFGRTFAINDNYLVVGSAYYDEGSALSAGTIWVLDVNDSYNELTRFTPSDATQNSMYGFITLLTDDDLLFVSKVGDNDGKFIKYDLSGGISGLTTSAETVELGTNYGYYMSLVGDRLYVGAQSSADDKLYVYNTNDLSLVHTFDLESNPYASGGTASIGPSSLNGVTITQSDNVFTVTPGTADANFQLRITATDSEGNATSVTPTFAYDFVNQPPAVAGIDAAYTLTQGQDTVITAAATDPEGDAITWSFEETLGSDSKYVFVGARYDDDNGTNSGSVYVYDSNDLSAQPIKLTAFDGASGDSFSKSIVAAAGKIFVGATGDDDNGTQSGSVYVFDANNLSATPTNLTAFDATAYDNFGTSLAAIDDKVFIGAYGGTSQFGAVYVYDANDLSAQPTKLTAFDADPGAIFGWSIATSADKVVVGAIYDDDNGSLSGSVYVYDANNLSAQPTKLTAFDGAANDYFGSSVAVTDDKIVVGVYNDDDNGSNSGSVYVYDANNLSAQPTKLTAFDGSDNDNFGKAISAGAGKIVVGATGDDDNGSSGINSNTGSVYVYDANDLSAQPTKLTAFDGSDNDNFGETVSVTADKIFVGSLRDDDNASDSGSVYVYDTNDLSAQPTKLTPSDGVAYGLFGYSVAQVAISPTSALNGTTVTQSDNVFTVTPGQQDSTFQLTFKATDTAGNVTSTTSDFTLDYVNQAPSVAGIDAAYTLTQGQDTQIVGLATDAEGEDITWSFEEVLGGSSGYVVVAALGDDGYDGSVYIYNSSDLSATPTKLDTPAGATNFFGRDFEIIGDNLIVTADGDDTLGNDAGAAFVYDMTDLSISPTKITAPDGASGNKFGYSVTSSSDKVIISSRAVGKVYVYDANDLTATPTILTGETNDFGDKVTSNSNYIFVSDPFNNHGGNRAGSVYVYDIDSLSLVTEIEHQASTTAYFGKALSANEEKLAVGGWIAGLVYVYDLNNLSSTPETTIYGYASHKFGVSVGLSDNKLVVGASDQSKAYVYDLANLPEYANYQDDLNPNSSFYLGRLDPTNEPTSDDRFGYSVSVNDDNIVVAAYGDNNNTGSTYVYDANDLSATPTILTAFDGAEGDTFGSEVVKIFDISPTSALNGTIVAQSDNVFTVTPGTTDADFQLTFKATDTSGNVTSVTSDFDFTYVNQAPVVAGIESSYLLSAGGDAEVITAAGSDVEGDAITWSFEEVASGGGSQIVIGSFLKNNYSGSVFVYENGDLSSSPTEIYPSDVASGDRFGQEISVTPSHMAVSTWNGKVYVYDQSDLSVAPTKLTSPEGSSNFGQEGLAINDTHLFVGQSSGGPDSNGVVYVYSLSDLSASPTELSQTGGEFLGDGGDRFGSVVAADNQSLVVSASHYDNGVGAQNVGRLYVYDVSDLSAAPTVVSNIGYQDNTETGNRELMLTSDKIIVGSSQYKDGNGVRKGVVFVHDRNNLDQAPVIVMGHEENGNFGLDAYADDDILVVGATSENSSTGAAYVYDMSDLSATPTKLTAYDGAASDSFGWEVYATASNILIGSYNDDDAGNNSGAVYVYDRSDLSAQPTKLIGQGANAYFGNTFAGYAPESSLSGTTVTQSDNVFTVTPGSEATSFSMRFTATDANGNATTTTSAFTVEEASEPAIASYVFADGNPDDSIRLSDTSIGNFGSDDFTIDFWVKSDGNSEQVMSKRDPMVYNNQSWEVELSGGLMNLRRYNNGYSVTTIFIGSVQAEVWNHVSITRYGGDITGSIYNSSTQQTNQRTESLGGGFRTSNHPLEIGGMEANFNGFLGKLADIRISNAAEYHTNGVYSYTPPTAGLPVTANTVALIRSMAENETGSSSAGVGFVDYSGNTDMTLQGNPTIDTNDTVPPE
jgi:hypothetical protein